MDALADLAELLSHLLPAWRFFLVLALTALVAWLTYRQISLEPYAPYVVGALVVTGLAISVQWQWGSSSRNSGLS